MASINVRIADLEEVKNVIEAAAELLAEVSHKGDIKSHDKVVQELWSALNTLGESRSDASQ